MINEIILLINDVEYMVDHKISASTMDKLILAHMRLLIKTYGYKDGVDLKSVTREIDQIIKHPRSLQIEYLVSIFNEVELDRLLSRVPFKKTGGKWRKYGVVWDRTNIDNTKISDEEIKDICNSLGRMSTQEEYDVLLTGLIDQFKQQIVWN